MKRDRHIGLLYCNLSEEKIPKRVKALTLLRSVHIYAHYLHDRMVLNC